MWRGFSNIILRRTKTQACCKSVVKVGVICMPARGAPAAGQPEVWKRIIKKIKERFTRYDWYIWYMIYTWFELNDCWPTERAYCIYVIFKVILCLYFSTLHSLFVLLQHALILILDLYFWYFSFLHYWGGCKAKLIWCLDLCLSLMFNCYPPYFREFLFLLKC